VAGGKECQNAFQKLTEALRTEFRSHDPLIQALALHYHFAAMHPFLDGNGRTARALEALLLQRAGLRDTAFIAMSNYYYEEKANYLAALSNVRASGSDLTPFLIFGLRGIAIQCQRLAAEIRSYVLKAVYRNLMNDLFGRLESARKRVIAKRQLGILEMLLDEDEVVWPEIIRKTKTAYSTLKNGQKARVRDMNGLLHLGAVGLRKDGDGNFWFRVRLEWPSTITETEFFNLVEQMPKAKTHRFLG
jgi:Fic family protein